MINFATIGSNFITERFLTASKNVKGLCFAGAYSRTKENAQRIAQKFGAKKIFTDLNELAQDADIDAVYIASPNALHCEQAVLMLNAKKHVLCEKTIASNIIELKKMIDAANDNNVVLLEGVRSMYDPAFCVIEQNLPKLGKIQQAVFQYCQYSSRYDNFKKGIIENAFNPELSNGALTDIGVYCVHPLIRLFSKPKYIEVSAQFLENEVDGAGCIFADYDDMQAQLIYSKIHDCEEPSTIIGENAAMCIKEIANPYDIEIIYKDGTVEKIYYEKQECNLVYEIEEWVRLIETDARPDMQRTVDALSLMDEAREIAGIVFPADGLLNI